MTASDVYTDEHTEEHADGIKENRETPPPSYFNILFYGLIIWGILYCGYFLFSGWSSSSEFDEKMAAHKQMVAKQSQIMDSSNQ